MTKGEANLGRPSPRLVCLLGLGVVGVDDAGVHLRVSSSKPKGVLV
jgi:hypothetical protein